MKISDRQLIVTGWLLFMLSAIGFIWSSVQSGDIASLIGGILFLIACFVFMVPYIRGSM